jgi:putative DNA primase/helicase
MQDKQVDWADIGTAAGRSDINDLIARHDAQVVVLDNLSAWQRTGGKENDAESWNEVAGWLLHLRSQGVAVVIIHHQGKNGLQRGTSKKEDILDTIIGLKRPPDYDPSDGLRVCLEFEKARNLDGSEIPSVEVSLKVADGVATFDVIKTQSDPISVVHALIDDGATRGEIQNALGMDRFQLKRLEERSVKLGRPFKLPDARSNKKSAEKHYSNIKGGE